MGVISVNNIRVYAFHGCLAEEAVIGGEYVVDVTLHTDFLKAEQSDQLEDTVDYCQVFEIVKREMKIRSKLIEHVGRRIADALKKEILIIDSLEVHVKKITPPMNGNVGSVSVIVVA